MFYRYHSNRERFTWLTSSFLLALCLNLVTAKTYYVSSSGGSDSNSGTSTSAPWQTFSYSISNFNKIVTSGDKVLLKRGDVWFDGAIHNSKLDNVFYGAYGSASDPLPLIQGGYEIPNSGWVKDSTTKPIWRYQLPDDVTPPADTFVWLNGKELMTRAQSPYYTLDGSYSETTSWIRGDGTRTDGYFDDTVVVIRASPGMWVDRNVVSSRADGTISLDQPVSLKNVAGYAYFFRGARKFLDAPGEWFLDTTKNIVYVWLPDGASPNGYAKKLTINVIDTGFRVGGTIQNVTVDSMRFQYQTRYGVDWDYPTGGTVSNCEFFGIFDRAIVADVMMHTVITKNTISWTSEGMLALRMDSSTISFNTLTDIGLRPEQTSCATYIGSGIAANNGSNTLFVGNKLVRIGFMGIRVHGVNHIATQNYIEDSMLAVNDGGALYIGPQPSFYGSLLKDNIINRVSCNLDFQPSDTSCMGHGIYLDWICQKTTIIGNTVMYAASSAIYSNGGWGHVVKRNILYESRDWALFKVKEGSPGENGGWTIEGNFFYVGQGANRDNSRSLRWAYQETSKSSTPFTTNKFADNVYWGPYGNELLFRVTYGGKNYDMSLAGWQAFLKRDVGAVYGPYQSISSSYSIIKANLVRNPNMLADSYKSGPAEPWGLAGGAKISGELILQRLIPDDMSLGAQRVCEWAAPGNCYRVAADSGCTGEGGRLQSVYWNAVQDGFWVIDGVQTFLLEFSYASAADTATPGETISVQLALAATGKKSDWGLAFPLDPTPRTIRMIVTNNSTQSAGEGRIEFILQCGFEVVFANVRATEISDVQDLPDEAVVFTNPESYWQVIPLPAGAVFQDLNDPTKFYCGQVALGPYGAVILARSQNLSDAQAASCNMFDGRDTFPILGPDSSLSRRAAVFATANVARL